MADSIQLVFDVGPALRNLAAVRTSLDETEKGAQDLGTKMSAAFSQSGDSTQDFIGDVQDLSSVMAKAQQAIRDLTKYAAFLERQQKRTTDPKLIKRYAQELTRTKVALKDLRDTGVDAWDDISAGQDKTVSSFGRLGGFISRALPLLSLSAVTLGAIKAAGAYEQTVASFEVLLKSASKAENLLADLNAASVATPFEPQQYEQAARGLLAVGTQAEAVVPTLQQIATISSATGKDFNELAIIFSKARSAGVLYAEDINQLIDAGIPIIGEFAEILDTTPDKVKKLASQGKVSFAVLEEAFDRLTRAGGRYAGLLERQAETLPGAISTFQGVFQNLLRVLGGGEIGRAAKGLVNVGTELLKLVTNQFIPANEKAARAFDEQAKKVADLDDGLTPLLDKYDELTAKTNPTVAEQEDLKTVIQQIGEITPGAITQIDAYGNAIAVNADKAREFLEAEKARLKFVNTEAIKATEAFVSENQKRLSEIQKLVQAGNRLIVGERGAASRLVSLSAREISNLQAEARSLQEALKGARAELARLRGEDIPTPEEVAPDTGGGGPSEQEIKAALERERRRQQLRLDLMQEGRAKELAIEQIRTEENLAELRKYFAGRKEINDLIEKEQERHLKNVQDINDKYAQEELTKILDSLLAQNEQEEKARQGFLDIEKKRQDLRLSLLEDGTQKEIDLEKKRFEGVRKQIEDTFAGTEELQGLIEQAREEHIARLNEINRKGLVGILETEREKSDREFDLIAANNERVILLMKQRGASEEDIAKVQAELDLVLQKKRLEAELKFQEALLRATSSGDTARIEQIRDQIDILNQQIENIDIKIGTPDVGGGGGFDLGDLLGLGPDDIEALKKAASEVVASIESIIDARVRQAEEEFRIAQERVQAAEDALDREIALNEQGFASNVSRRQDELEAAKKAEAQALEDRKKAQRQQALVDGLQQTVSLITASANIFKALSGLGPIGVGIAVATIATMFGAFAKVKLDAARAARFRKGGRGRIGDQGVIVGAAHEAGGVPIEVEHGEFIGSDGKEIGIVRRHMTRKHIDLLSAINSDDRGKMAEILADLLSDQASQGSDIEIPAGSAAAAAGSARVYGPEIAAQAAQDQRSRAIFLSPASAARTAERSSESASERPGAEIAEMRKSNKYLSEQNDLLRRILASGKKGTAYFPGGREEFRPGFRAIIKDRG